MQIFRKLIKIVGCGVVIILFFYLFVFATSERFPALVQTLSFGVPDPIPLSGTGSMYPTFPKGTSATYQGLVEETVATPSMYRYPSGFTLLGKQYLPYTINHGDIVSFETDITRRITLARNGKESGFIKRVIGIAGDVIELRNGVVYRNKEPIKEPYVARAQSTFGGEFLAECHELTVPANQLFVMGDNRKGSNDSRFQLGLVSANDVDHFIPYAYQIGHYDKNWHNAENDLDTNNRITLDKSAFMKLLNDKRREKGLTPLKYNDKLDLSAKKRGEVILRTNDFSYEATVSGYTMEKAMKEVGYKNIVWAEIPVQGYYESNELFEHLYESSNLQQFLLDKDFQDFAITPVMGDLNKCPTQIIVMHIAGYKPPDYSADVINSWKNLLKSLIDSEPGWRESRNVDEYYSRHKAQLDRMIELFEIRIRNVTSIVETMESNQWLNDEQEAFVKMDAKYGEEQNKLAEEINQP